MPQSIKGELFPEWGPITFGDMFEEIKQKTSDTEKYPLYSLTIENGVTEKTERYERSFLVTKDEDNYKIVPPNAFVYNPMNLRFGALAVNHTGKTVSVSQYYNVFKMKDESVLPFWENYLVMPSMLRFYFSIATGSLLEKLRVHYSDFVKIKKTLPSIEEQRKISEFLSLYDKRIAAQTSKVEALETRRKGLLQQIFSQEIRFKADDGSEFPDWESHAMGEFFTERKEKAQGGEELLSVTIANGVIRQADSDKRDNSSEDKSNYKRVMTGDMAYNTMRMWQGAEGVSYWDGIVSPAYTIIIPEDGVNAEFFMVLFKTYDALKQFTIYSQGMTSDQWNLKFDIFADLEFDVPCSEEQAKIVAFFKLLDKQIQIEKDKLDAIKQVKKGLLQQMFV